MRRSGSGLIGAGTIVLGALLIGQPAAAKSDPAAKCSATKVQAAGKKAGAKLKCWAKAVKKAIAVDPLCLGTAEEKFDAAYAKIEAKGGCLTNGDAPAIEALVDSFVAGAVGALPDGATPEGAKCASSKIQAAGKKADGKLKCHAKAIGKAIAVDAACITKVEGKFSAAFAKVEAKGGCATTGDAGTIEASVDDLVTSVLGSLSGFVATVSVSFNPQVVLDLAGVELSVDYPQAKVTLPGTGNTPEITARLANLGLSSNSLQGSDDDNKLFIVYGGATPTDVPPGPVVRVTFDKPGSAPLANEFSCTVTGAFDSFGLSVGGVTCSVSIP